MLQPSCKSQTIVHEQNSIPGVTNKFLSRYATRVALAFQEAGSFFPSKKNGFTGNPRAQEVADLTDTRHVLSHAGLKTDKKTIVIFAVVVVHSKSIPQSLKRCLSYQRKIIRFFMPPVKFTTTTQNFQKYSQLIIKKKISKSYPISTIWSKFSNDANLILSRAGATSLAEITALGLPSILVPSPYVTADHQTKNAEALENAGAAIMIKKC